MSGESNPVDLPRLKQLIREGIQAIPADRENTSAVLVIGDTGVGKSTIMSFLAGSNLVVKYDGLKPTLDNQNNQNIRIGHAKYSQTSVPTKVVIDKMAFYDCPGFRDNKGEEYEISNSFFVQRLLDMYQKVKLVLIVDQSHISEARADKLPKLIRNLHTSFKTFSDIQNGVCVIINRAAPDLTIEDYHKEIKRMIGMKIGASSLFNQDERGFLQFLLFRKRVLLFRQAGKEQRNQDFKASAYENSILQTIKDSQYVKSKHIQNILSQSAKLAIRDFIDQITRRSNIKIERICAEIIQIYTQRAQALGRDVAGIINLKDVIIRLADQLKATQKEQILTILQRELPPQKIEDFQEDFASILFFKGIYDKTSTYFSNLINKIYSQLSGLLTKLDKNITRIQRENEEIKVKQKQDQEIQQRKEMRKKEEYVAVESCTKMNELKIIGQKLIYSQNTLVQRIKAAIKNLSEFEMEIRKTRTECEHLKSSCKQITYQFEQVSVTYFKSTK